MRYLKQLNKHKNNKTKSEMKHKTLTFRFLDMSRGGFARLFLLLLLPCLSVIGVKADSNGGVKFNPGVRYSQWAINSRLYDFKANTKAFGFAKYNSKGGNLSERNNKEIDKLDYVPGLVAKATIEAADYYQGFDWSKPWFLSVKEYGDTYSNSVPNGGGSLDDLNAVKLYIGLYNNINATETDKNNAKAAISSALDGLVAHDKSYSIQSGTLAGDAVVGGWFHKTAYNNQMWLDGAYMGSALLAQIVNFNGTGTHVFESTTADWDMVFKQLNIVWNMCWNSTDKLMYHAFEANAGTKESNSHADTWAGLNGTTKPYTFHSAAYWGRANAWYLMALVDVLEAMKNANQENSTNYTTLKQHLADLAAGIAARQDSKTGGWYQVMDKNASFTASSYNSNWTGKPASVTNYIETSATAIFTAAYFKAVRCGLLESTTQYDYKTIAKNAFEGLVNNYTYLDANGDMQIWGSCRSAGLGGGTGTDYAAEGKKYRDGSNEYYLLGYDVPMVKQSEGITEGKVLGGFIMAATEYERAYQNQDCKQILFARDLAPSYDFTTTPGTLDATAYGDGTVTYQWYKDGKVIAKATSAAYTPKESGSYYCIATSATNSRSAGSNTIQTSTTTVTTANTDNGSTDNNNGGSENGTATGNIFSYTIKASEATAKTPYPAEGGTVTLGAAKVEANGFKSDGDLGSSKYILVSLTNNTLKEGDVIKISAYSESTGKGGLVACKDNTKGASSVSLGNMTKQNEDITYTITASDILNGLSKFYLYRNGTATYIKSISITRPVKKYAVSATAGEGGSVTIANASGTTVNSGSEVEEKASLTFTATPSEGYEFVNWTDASNAEVSTDATYTTTVSAAISLTANFKAKTPVTPTEGGVIYDFTGSIGTTTNGTNCTTANNVITFSSNFSAKDGKYITISPKTGGFKAGDVITLNGYCNSKNLSGVIIYSNVNGSSIFKSNILAKSDAGGSEFTYTIEKDCDALYLGRYGGGTTCLTSLQVKRSASSYNKTRLTASFERNADVVVNTTKTVTLPTLTVKAGENILAADQYDVVYKSNADGVATLSDNSDNTIIIKSLGIATITATVTPKDANTYEGTTATYQLSVKAPSPLNVSVMDVTINTTDAEVEQPIIKVYGDNDKLLKLGQDYTLSFAVSGDNVTVDASGNFSVTKTGNKWTKGTSLITVTATPTTSLGSNYIAGTLQFSYSVSEGKIKPVFLDSFKDITINLHQDDTSREIIVPLIYNGEDVSSYFKYTYTITPTGNTSSVTGSALNYTPSTAGTYTVTVSATPGSIGTDNYSDVYDSPDAITFTLNVDSKYQVITVTPDPTSIKMYTGTTQVAPDLTVKNGNATLGDTEYNVKWFSTSPGVVKVDATTGKIEAVSEGTANIRVVVTGKKLESTTALISVEVDDPALYRVKSNGETYGNQAKMRNQDGTLSVTLGGWMFPNDGKPDTNILDQTKNNPEKLSNSYQWDKTSSKAKWKLTGFDYYVSGNNSKNARQENGSNAMPETTTIGSADFKKYTIEVKDPMFNVPCSGSFLVFNPKTNGKVTAHIFQNGVFDTSGGKYSYRPQRRVFVMDEAGNFVTSTAHIESTNGKPTGGVYDLTTYGWDLNGGKAPTEAEVASHFDGLESFVMTQDGFKNNVYPSALSADIMPNNKAITNHPNDKSAHGWCVLADSPVTYTFKVKAGKTYYLYNFGSKIGFYGFSFDEGETKPTVDEVSYADDKTNDVKETKAGHVAKVSINRSMKAGIWTTCVLPFSLNKEQVDAIFGETYSATAPQGTQILYFDRVEGNKVYFVRHAYNTIVAGKPFLIKPTKEVTSINTADVEEYPYVTIENTNPTDWCAGNGYTWASSYSNNMTVKEGDGFISNKDGSFKNFVGPNGTLKGFRGYLKRTETQAGAKPIMLQVVNSSNVDGNNGETTGIEDLIIDADGQLMPANGKVYNINGQLVSEDANSFQSLPSGIYIINGKKYIK
jgi:rhamnogalacturonyl hydrolase YesR